MFTEDIHLAIMPIGGRTDKQKEFFVEFQGDAPDYERAKEIVGELGEFDRYDTAGMVCDAIDSIARHLAWEGQALFEIIYDEEQIYLNGLTTKNIFRVFNWYLQLIPPSDWELWKRKMSLVTKKKIWKVQMPHELGGVWGYKKVLRKLRKYNHLGPGFYRRDLERGTTVNGFDFLRYVRDSEIYFNSVTKAWGWNRRDWSQDKCTEFYTFHRMLSFKHAQALLREHIIREINRLLQKLEIKCKLVVAGLPTSNDILKIKTEMQRGELSFAEVTDKVAM
ncbi:hypothetical protein [Neptuniibacter marinus]|uniref:hypothetical protein n=1 Tax=Neptuniibacter marinus TaxID=1806670 RepID=UPI003B5CE4AF